jgi:hypothetical protein
VRTDVGEGVKRLAAYVVSVDNETALHLAVTAGTLPCLRTSLLTPRLIKILTRDPRAAEITARCGDRGCAIRRGFNGRVVHAEEALF